ncbi:MAG: hypothetical protein QG661_161 [Actinomycetota bacterium]|nr:hypothetical protein [Actinomycetota bacterium]
MHLIHHPAELLASPTTAAPPRSRQRLGLAAIVIAAFFMAADITITNVALPSIAEDLDASMSSLQWVVDSYNIAVAGLVLLGAGLAERYSRTWTFLSGVMLFTVGSLAAGLSSTVPQLVGARTIMGVGGALVVAPALSLIAVLFPPEQRAKAVAAWAAAGSLGLALSPIAGGMILSVASWHWAFLINVPAMVVTIVLGAVVLPRSRNAGTARLDVIGALLSVLGLGLFLGAVIEGPSLGWGSPAVIGAGLAGVIALTGFVLWELHHVPPMFEVRVLTRRGVLGASISLFGSYVAFTGSVFLVAQDLQVVRQTTPIQLGLSLVPFAVTLWLVSRQAGRLASAWGSARTISVGMVLLVASFCLLTVTAGAASPAFTIVGTVVVGAGTGLVIPLASVVILNDLPPSLTGSASGTSMLARFAGASFGVAILGTVLATAVGTGNAHADPAAFTTGVTAAYLAGTLVLLALTLAQWWALRSWREPGT